MQTQDILKYFQIIRKWWWVIVLLFGVTLGTMVGMAYLSETQYEAVTTVLISAPPPQEVPLYSQFGRAALSEEIVQTRASFSELLLVGEAANDALASLPDIQMKADDLRARTTTEVPESSNLLRVHVLAPDPDTAALLANTLVEAALAHYGELLAASTIKTRSFIESQFEAAQAELKAATAELEQFKIENKIGDLDSAIRSQYDYIKNLRLQGDRARVEGKIEEGQALEKIILEREAELQNMIGLSANYNELASRVARAETTYSFLLDKKTEAQIKENQIKELTSIQVITPAHPPKRPATLINNQLIILGGIASLIAGILLAFLLEYWQISTVSSRSYKREPLPEMVALSDNPS
jgi:uncharacterized protein involved in exopolysaccharide biosynthesis